MGGVKGALMQPVNRATAAQAAARMQIFFMVCWFSVILVFDGVRPVPCEHSFSYHMERGWGKCNLRKPFANRMEWLIP